MEPLHFPGRGLQQFGEYVKSEDLVVGEVYFRVVYSDDQLLIPEMTPLVFAGRDLDEKDWLYFQDVTSYMRGDRWGMDHPPLDGSTEIERFEQLMRRGCFQSFENTETSHVFVFEKALDVLLRCSLDRRERAQKLSSR